MNRTELLDILANGENSGVEFKRDDVNARSLAKELVAFSNLDGGMVVLGVEDNGEVSGLTRSPRELEEWVMNVCRDKIRPAITHSFDVFNEVQGEKGVAVVRVPRTDGVRALWDDDGHRYLVRVGAQSREAGQEELARVLQQKGAIRAELRPVSGTTIEDLDRRKLRNYFLEIRRVEFPNDDSELQILLENTEFMVDGSATVGGMLLFGLKPNRFLPQAGIYAAAYPGTEKDYEVIERATLRGPLLPLRDANGESANGESANGESAKAGLVEQALEFVKRNTPAAAALESGPRRAERPTYPTEVLREAIVNAIIHRDYLLSGTKIDLSIYSDRLEVVSPGRLPHKMTPERMRQGGRIARNKLVAGVIRNHGYLKGVGMGVRWIVIGGMKEHNGTEPDLVEQHERFTVRLFAQAPDKGNEA